MSIVPALDAIHANVGHLPSGIQVGGYVTGTPEIAWTDADWKAHPDAIRIDQSPTSSQWDATADVDDYERGAVTLDELPRRAQARIVAYNKVTRPGQRRPAIYASASNITQVVNALNNGGVHSGVGLWIANWNFTVAQAVAEVAAASGPFPIIGVQYANDTFYDHNVFSFDWLSAVSHHAPTGPLVSGEVLLPGYADKGIYFNEILGTVGYHDHSGQWHRIALPRGH
jgi:hypothetical protein